MNEDMDRMEMVWRRYGWYEDMGWHKDWMTWWIHIIQDVDIFFMDMLELWIEIAMGTRESSWESDQETNHEWIPFDAIVVGTAIGKDLFFIKITIIIIITTLSTIIYLF